VQGRLVAGGLHDPPVQARRMAPGMAPDERPVVPPQEVAEHPPRPRPQQQVPEAFFAAGRGGFGLVHGGGAIGRGYGFDQAGPGRCTR